MRSLYELRTIPKLPERQGAVMATHQRGVIAWAVDSWEGKTDFPGGEPEQAARWRAFLTNMAESGLEKYSRIVKLRSTEAAALFDDGSLDLVFIDGNHSGRSVGCDPGIMCAPGSAAVTSGLEPSATAALFPDWNSGLRQTISRSRTAALPGPASYAHMIPGSHPFRKRRHRRVVAQGKVGGSALRP